MGQSASADEPSSTQDGDDATKQDEYFDEEEVKRAFRNVTDENLLKAPEAFRQAYADDPKALAELERLVQEIETGGTGGAADAGKQAKAAAAERKAETAERRAARAADQEAGDWLKEQLRLHEEQQRRYERQKAKEQKAKKEASSLPQAPTPGPDKGSASAGPAATAAGAKSSAARPPPAPNSTPCRPADGGFAKEVPDGAAEPGLEHGDADPSASRWRSLGSLPTPQAPVESLLEDAGCSPPAPSEAMKQPVPALYALLGVAADATFEEIKRGYRKQALRWHPDKNRGPGQEAKAVERFKRINEAFDTLFDPQKREMYDSGQVRLPGKAKRLQGHGWAQVADEDEAALTPQALKLKKQSWAEHVYFGGRVGDVDPVYEEKDPRTPQEKVRVFWRRIGEAAYEARESAEGKGDEWLKQFLVNTWKDTPTRWPSGLELQGMSETSQGEWKERRMVYNRRKMKVLLHIEAHEDYLATPDLEEKKKARLEKIWPGRIK